MRCFIYAAFAVGLLASGPVSAQTVYGAGDLLSPCTEADNDARWGEVAELECEQYIMGFVDALAETGDKTVCVPAQNTADEVRWAYMRWVHEDYSARKAMTAGAALLGTLQAKFKCP